MSDTETTPARQQRHLAEALLIIADPQERLTAVMSRRSAIPRLSPEEKIDAALVPGCQSRVWLIGRVEEGQCHFRIEADSPLVHGLATLLAEVYENAPAPEAAAFSTTLISELRFDRQLSPTRLHGLSQVVKRLQAIAAEGYPSA